MPEKTLLWLPLALLSLVALGCRDDLLTTEPPARGDPIATAAPSVFAYQLRADPWLNLLAERSGHGDISLELDNALYALDPDGGGAPSSAPAALLASRQTLEPAEQSDKPSGPGEADLLSAILGLTVDRVTTILDHPESPYPGIWPASRTPSPSAER
jgi:hypothetical protein